MTLSPNPIESLLVKANEFLSSDGNFELVCFKAYGNLILLRRKDGCQDNLSYLSVPVVYPDLPPASPDVKPEDYLQNLLESDFVFRSASHQLPTHSVASSRLMGFLSPSEAALLRKHNMEALRVLHADCSSFPSDVPASFKRLNVGLMALLCNCSNYSDSSVLELLSCGFPLYGFVTGGTEFPRVHVVDALPLEATTSQGLSLLKKHFPRQSNAIQEAVYTECLKEVADGKLLGPLTESQLPFTDPKFKLAPRFGLEQSDKVRVIDNHSYPKVGNSINSCTWTDCKVNMPSLDHVVQFMSLLPNCYVGKADHKSAYKQLPLAPEHGPSSFIVISHQGQFLYFQLLAYPFGARSSVVHYLRVSTLLFFLCRTVMLVPLLTTLMTLFF